MVATLVSAGILAIMLAGLLPLVQHQQRLSARSHAWEAALHVAEAGIEEALSHIAQNGATNLACQGWSKGGSSYAKTNSFDFAVYTVTISTAAPPTISCRGSAQASMSGDWITREVTITTSNMNAYGIRMAIAGKGQIELDANANPSLVADSFDSSDPAHSLNGAYNEALRKDGGDCGTMAGSGTAFTLNANCDISGHGMTAGSSIGCPSGNSIGSLGWVDGNHSGIEPGWFDNHLNISFPAVEIPSGLTSIASLGSSLGPGRYKKTGGASLSSTLTINGPTILYVSGGFSLSGSGKIVIAPGASLDLYMDKEATWNSSTPVDNQTGKAANCSIFGTSGMTAFHLMPSAAGTFIGTVYAPNAQLEIGSGGKNYTLIGGVVGGPLVHFNGGWRIHYDEALNGIGPKSAGDGLVVASWREQ